jgi:hypothetical protein
MARETWEVDKNTIECMGDTLFNAHLHLQSLEAWLMDHIPAYFDDDFPRAYVSAIRGRLILMERLRRGDISAFPAKEEPTDNP